MLHSKVLVLGGIYEDDEFFTGVTFSPDLVWIGSANWTREAEHLHTESAVAVADHSFVKDSMAYVTQIISQSEKTEKFESTPSPNLAPAEFDDEAFAYYAAEFGGPE